MQFADLSPILKKADLQMEKNNLGFILIDSLGRKLQINFDVNKVNYFRKNLSKKNDLLAKALGILKGNNKVLELGAGLGIDTVHMASLGCKVTSIERNPIIYFLLQEALVSSNRPELKSIQFLNLDAKDYLNAIEPNTFDVIYFDPMYPHKKKSALPKQEMLIFRDLVGDDMDSGSVLHLALQKAKRVVVKRPVNADPIQSPVTHSFVGKSVRFDVYSKV